MEPGVGCAKCICNRWCVHGISCLPKSIVDVYGVYGESSGSCGERIEEGKHITLIDANCRERSLINADAYRLRTCRVKFVIGDNISKSWYHLLIEESNDDNLNRVAGLACSAVIRTLKGATHAMLRGKPQLKFNRNTNAGNKIKHYARRFYQTQCQFRRCSAKYI